MQRQEGLEAGQAAQQVQQCFDGTPVLLKHRMCMCNAQCCPVSIRCLPLAPTPASAHQLMQVWCVLTHKLSLATLTTLTAQCARLQPDFVATCHWVTTSQHCSCTSSARKALQEFQLFTHSPIYARSFAHAPHSQVHQSVLTRSTARTDVRQNSSSCLRATASMCQHFGGFSCSQVAQHALCPRLCYCAAAAAPSGFCCCLCRLAAADTHALQKPPPA